MKRESLGLRVSQANRVGAAGAKEVVAKSVRAGEENARNSL